MLILLKYFLRQFTSGKLSKIIFILKYLILFSFFLRILNDKDDPPSFIHKNYHKEIVENTNSFILKLEAKTSNKYRSSNITYFIPKGYRYANFFNLNQFNGELTTAFPLDREFKSSFNIPVYAFNQNYKHFAFTYVNVDVSLQTLHFFINNIKICIFS